MKFWPEDLFEFSIVFPRGLALPRPIATPPSPIATLFEATFATNLSAFYYRRAITRAVTNTELLGLGACLGDAALIRWLSLCICILATPSFLLMTPLRLALHWPLTRASLITLLFRRLEALSHSIQRLYQFATFIWRRFP
jgi:hypothetical protein